MALKLVENKKLEEKKKKIGNSLIITLILVVFLMAMAIGSYFLEINRIIDTSIQNMEELAKHDEQAMRASLENRWRILEGIAANLRQEKCETAQELLQRLSTDKQLLDCIRISLVSETGAAMHSNLKIDNDSELLDMCLRSEERFAHRLDNVDVVVEGSKEVLMMGTKIMPITVDGVTYSWLLCRLDIDALQEELKIDSYEGRGFSIVIDGEGNYIVKTDRNHTPYVQENFFQSMAGSQLLENDTPEQIQQKFQNRESFSFSYVSADGERYVAACIPAEGTDWYFIMTVPKAVFEEQSVSLMIVFTLLLGIVLVVCVAIGAALMHRRSALLKLEAIHRRELSSALILAERANRVKTAFLNNMSHDIRTPVNAIIGFAALAASHIEDKERVGDYLDKISRSSNHLLSLIENVLDMSNIESGKMYLEKKPENLAEIIYNIQNAIQADIHFGQLEFFIDTTGVIDADIYCDRMRLNQVLINLLSNAIKFTPPGGSVSFRILQKPMDREGYGAFEFRVKDTGIGMSPEFTRIIFQPFAKERASAISDTQGIGLGMAITKNLVDMMDGTIEVHSKVNEGTEFVVNLEFKLQKGSGETRTALNLEEDGNNGANSEQEGIT